MAMTMLTWLWAGVALAGPVLDAAQYARRFPLKDESDPDHALIQRCLSAWPDHPFSTPESRRFRVLDGTVRVLGLGTDPEVRDEVATSYPQLILIRPNVSAPVIPPRLNSDAATSAVDALRPPSPNRVGIQLSRK